MKKKLRQRGCALLTAAMLVFAAAGFAGIAEDMEPSAPVIEVEAVDQVDEQGDVDWSGDGFSENDQDFAPEITLPPEPIVDAGDEPVAGPTPGAEGDAESETIPEPTVETGSESAPGPAVVTGEEAPATDAAPESTAIPEDASAPVETAVPEETVLLEAYEAGETPAEDTPGYEADAPTALAFPVKIFYMGKGEHNRLAALTPEGVEAVGVTYKSNKSSVVKTDADGNLYARKKGVAKITATATNGVKASFKVRVVKSPSKVRLSNKRVIIGVDEWKTLTAKMAKGTASAITWTSSDPAVVEVDAAGNLRGVSAGKAKVTARTYNGKKASCTVTVLNGHTPTSLSFPTSTVYLGLKEKLQLAPILGEGEAAVFSFSSSKKRVASVTSGGLVKAKSKGTAQITVKTHNGLVYLLTVVVTNAPDKVSLSKTKLSLVTGEAYTLEVGLPANTSSALIWSSTDEAVVMVDGSGNLVAVSPGTAKIKVKTYNGKSASCKVTVTAPPEPGSENKGNIPPSLTNAEMANNLRNSSSLGSKREAIAKVALLLMDAGYEPSFAAGVCANVYSEGTYGLFESSKYVANYQKRPKYFCYLDGGDYYTKKDGEYVLTAVYLSQEEIDAYTGEVEARLRFGEEKYYWNNWSGKKVYEVDLKALQEFIDVLTAGKWQGKFGLGITQWTGARTRKLMAYYRKYAGQDSSTITKDQVIAAENAMILYDLRGDYKKVYTGWRAENEKALYCADAAKSAGSWVCLKYEIPANKEQSAVKRGKNAAKFYKIMVGES